MSKSKPNKTQKSKPENIENIQSEVASFAASLGLTTSTSHPSSGFNDTDFRPKKKPLKNTHSSQSPKPTSSSIEKPTNSFLNGGKKQEIFDGQIKPPKVKFDKNRSSGGPYEKPRSGGAQFGKPRSKNWNNGKKDDKFDGEGGARRPRFDNPRSSWGPNESGNRDVGVGGFKSYEKFKKLPKLPLVKASVLGSWYGDVGELEEKVLKGEKKSVEIANAEEWKKLVEKKKELGERLLAQYAVDYESSRGESGDVKMLIATQKSGTAADKVSAYSVLIGDNPVANIRALDALLAMVMSKVGKRHALSGFEALKELFIQSLLPDRKLKTLVQRPLNHLPETKDGYSLLLFWYWEECLKLRYERFVSALEEASRDMLPILKDKALKIMYALLRSKSEQERKLLTALVNKLGDPNSKAASNADYYLTNLLSDHPNMKVVVIDEVDTFLFRPHLGLRSKYHAVNFLTQIRLSHRGDGPKVAKRLIDVYFALFKLLISVASDGQKNNKNEEVKKSTRKDNKDSDASESHVELDSRLLSVILTGVNRAFPFVSGDEADEIVEVQTPMLFQLVHSQNFNVTIQALMLIDKISSKNQVVSDRFYRALYAKMLLPAALNTSKEEMFIGLLLRAMKNDVNIKRVASFAKRLLQVALQQQSQYACGCLFLLSELLKARPPLWNMAIQNETADEDLEHFEDVPDDSEIAPEAKVPDNSDDDAVKTSGLNLDDSSSEDEEASSESSEEDVSDGDKDLIIRNYVEEPQEKSTRLSDNSGDQFQQSSTKHSLPVEYDPRRREPSFCNADRTSWWELTVLASHAHPSVSTMAKTLLSGANIVYNGNPLHDLSLTAFLDKFMEKKPKQSAWHGGSQIEPAKKLDMNKHLIGAEILSLAEDDVPPEDLIFHKFYMNKMSSSTNPKKKKKKKKGAEEEEAADLYGGDDESDNEEIEDLLDAMEPSLKADGDYDYDDLDNVDDDDDDDLIGDVSDNEIDTEILSDVGEADDAPDLDSGESDGDIDIGDVDDISDDEINIGDADNDDDDDDEADMPKKGKKRKSGKRSSASPFASLEEYEHLLNEDDSMEGKLGKDIGPRKKQKSEGVDKGKKAGKGKKHKKKRN